MAERRVQMQRQKAFFAKYRSVLEPFLPAAAVKSLPSKVKSATEEELSELGTRDTETPANVKAKMRDYQKRGLRWLLDMYDQGGNPILGDEMGSRSAQLFPFPANFHSIHRPRLSF